MTFKQTFILATLGAMLSAPLVGCGDDEPSDDGGSGGTDNKAGTKPSTGGKNSNGGKSSMPTAGEGGSAGASEGGAPTSDDSCDPKGADPIMGKLFNEPVESDVEVIVKKAQHPGKPGPLDLP